MGLDMYLESFPKNISGRVFTLQTVQDYTNAYHSLSTPEDKAQFIADNSLEGLFSTTQGWPSAFREVMYWRKANQIHKWFVENVQNFEDDCRMYEVSKPKLEELYAACVEVLNNTELAEGYVINGWSSNPNDYCKEHHIQAGKPFDLNNRTYNGTHNMYPIIEPGKYVANTKAAEELLPTEGGFFFGNTNYDQYYLYDIRQTKEQLEDIFNDFDWDNYGLVYSSSW